jgi:hypothetical protein
VRHRLSGYKRKVKPARLTVLLALGNVVLLAMVLHQARWLRRSGGSEPAGNPVAMADLSATAIREETMSRLTRERSALAQDPAPAPSGSTRPTMDWNQVEAPDYPTYIRNLRAIGVPEPTIRDIVTADVRQVFASRRAEVLAQEHEVQFWKYLPDEPETLANRMRQRREVDNAMGDVLRELLGPEVLPPSTENDWKLAELNLQLAFLPPDKRDSTSGLLMRYADIDAQIKSLADGLRPTEDPRELGRIIDLYEAKRAELSQWITPEEFEQIELTVSWTADNLRRAMVRFEPSEEEFRTIFRVWREHDEELARLAATHQPDPGNAHVFERIRAFLGEERFAQYRSTWWQ